MKTFLNYLRSIPGALIALCIPSAVFATVFWTSTNGDINFPGLTPTTIDGMAIGQTTPAAGKFTTLESTTPGPGAFTTLAAVSGPTINGNAGTVCPSFVMYGAPAAVSDTVFFVATRPFIVISVSEVHAVAAGGASVLQVTKDTGTNAPGAGTDLLTNNTNTGFDLAATANTVQVGTLVASSATKTLAAGDRLAVDFAQAIQATSGVTVTACLQPL